MKGTFHRYSTGKKIKVILAHAFLAVLAVVWLLPVLWVILTSFAEQRDLTVPPFSRRVIHWITI